MMLLFAVQALYVGNSVCAPCHAGIFSTYRTTPMARSSGVVSGTVPEGSFRHASSETEYQTDRSGAVRVSTRSRTTERKLDYFIGSGATGQSFLYSENGFLFQAPITWYSQQTRWDVSPGYESDTVSRWSRAIDPDCLNCHSSQVRSAEGFQNLYAKPPFAQAGIGCERCHGPGSEHVKGRARMINPARLDAARRDAVCAQCHMSGEARVDRAGMRFKDYRPGALLSEYVAYFVYQSAPALKATNYVEKLAASRCRLVSGDRLWCGTCHQPHRVPAAEERVAWFRERCLGCHQSKECARGPDCASCHMPSQRVIGGGHGMLTDHSIPRVPSTGSPASADLWRLQGFSTADRGSRELGLAYAEVAARTGDARQAAEALRLLSSAPQDAEVQVRLADLYRRRNQLNLALPLYQSVLRKEPGSMVALVNLGNYYGAVGKLDEAITFWREAMKRNPCAAEAAENLKTVYRAQGKVEELNALVKGQARCVIE